MGSNRGTIFIGEIMNNKQIKYGYILVGIIFSIALTLLGSNIIFPFLHIYDYSNENTFLRISMLDEANRKSYGHEMRIVSIETDGKNRFIKL